jgi:hypothetical protein
MAADFGGGEVRAYAGAHKDERGLVGAVRGDGMRRRANNTGQALQSARKHRIISEIQRAVARELAAQAEIPTTMPQRIADLMRELHRRLRNVDQEPP